MISKAIRPVISMLLYSGSFIGLCAACLTALTLEVADKAILNHAYILCIGFATAALYALHKIIGSKTHTPSVITPRFAFVRDHQPWMIMWCIVWAALTVISGWSILNFSMFLAMLPAIGIGLLYVLPILPGGRRLRDLGWSKIIWVGLVWGWLTAFIPLHIIGNASIGLSILHGVERMLFIMLLTIPFEIRDRRIDEASGLRTIPLHISPLTVRRISTGLALWILLLSSVMSFHYINPAYVLSMSLVSFIVIPLTRISYTMEDDFFFSGLIDGLMIVTACLYLLLYTVM